MANIRGTGPLVRLKRFLFILCFATLTGDAVQVLGTKEETGNEGRIPVFCPIDRSALNTHKSTADGPLPGSVSTWAMLIKRLYEVDPLKCACCGGEMKIVSFIERRQADVIEQILRHCGLWEGPLRTQAGPRPPADESDRSSTEPLDPQFVPDPDFLESEYQESQAETIRELQLVLDPDFL